MKIVVVGGGTAGHVLPTLPVIAALALDGHDICYIGTRSGLEEGLVAEAQCTYRGITAGKLRRYASLKNLLDMFRVIAGIVQALWLMLRLRPDVVFSKGGFVSFPVVFAAWLCRVPVVAHESDITPGLANRFAAPFVSTLCTSFPSTVMTEQKCKVVHTGTPLRASITGGNRAAGRALVGIGDAQSLLVVTGGSLGAERLNELVRESLDALCDEFFVFHVCGAGKFIPIKRKNYQQAEYVADGWGDILAAADVVISRAGANALFELVSLGKKNLLIPLSRAASRGDQIENAEFASAQGWSLVIAEEAVTTPGLMEGLNSLLEDAATWEKQLASFTPPDATEAIVKEIYLVSGVMP